MIENEAKLIEAADTIDYAQHAKQWERSGKNQVAYCQAQGLNYQKFVASRSKLRHSRGRTKEQSSRFIPVLPPATAPTNSNPNAIILRLPKGSVIELPSTLTPAQLSTVFKSLGAHLC